jgi:hypothetical protein
VVKVQRWDVHEVVLRGGTAYTNPFTDVRLEAAFIHRDTGKRVAVNGFYDGDSTWRIRLMPTEPGEWEYATTSNDHQMDGQSGILSCTDRTEPFLHGPLSVREHHFFHADGTPRFLISTRLSCHLSSPDTWSRAVRYLKSFGINRILFMMGGVAYSIKQLYGDGPDFWQYNVGAFRAIDTFIDALRREDIIASPYFYYFNDGVQKRMSLDQDKAYLRYGMARFDAYANVMPVLSNEVEQKSMHDRTASTAYDLRSHAWCNEVGPYLAEFAVFGVPVTVHNPMEHFRCVRPGFYTLLKDWPFPWASCMLRQMQLGGLGSVPEIRDDVGESGVPQYNARAYARHNELLYGLRKFGIPVVNEEPGYAHNDFVEPVDDVNGLGQNEYLPGSWNNQNPNTVLCTFWTAFLAGAYTMWGNFDTHETGDPFHGIKRTNTPRYLKILQDFASSVSYWDMEPINEAVSAAEELIDGKPYRTNFCLGRKGVAYIVFSLSGGSILLSLAPGARYRIEQMDPRTGRRTTRGTAAGGDRVFPVAEKEQVVIAKAEPGGGETCRCGTLPKS